MDIILGLAWLATSGEMKINWGKLTMRFDREEEEVLIKGDPNLT